MKKKAIIIILLLALSITTVFVIACGNNNENSTEITETETNQIETENKVESTEDTTETNQIETENKVESTEDTTDAGEVIYTDGYKSEEQLTQEELTHQELLSVEKFTEENLPGEGTCMARFQAWVRSQGADYASGWSFIYTHGDAAGDQPSYAVYMKPGSPDYGKVFHVGDTLPNGRIFWGTAREHEAYNAKQMEEQLIEDGNLTIDPETGKKIYSF